MNILVQLAYDGTEFAGYQVQRGQNVRTVQNVVEHGLRELHRAPVSTVCAGRTDAGVHAVGQYISFHTTHTGIPADQFAAALNSHMPQDVRAIRSCAVDDSFHARYSARSRTYRYYLYNAPWELPHRRRYAWRIPVVPDIDRMNEEVEEILGTHDFTTFAARRDTESMVRTIHVARFTQLPGGEGVSFHIQGDGFLWHMVRSLVGTFVDRERRRQFGEPPTEPVTTLLREKDRKFCGPLAPARGLFLYDVAYP